MKTPIAAALSLMLFAGSASAFDPFNGQGWQRSRPPAAVAYFKMPLQQAGGGAKASYGLAITAPAPRTYGAAPMSLADAPKLADLRFSGAKPETLFLSGQVAWSLDPAARERHNLLGIPGFGGTLFGLALTAGAAYGVYTVVKENCPAISTTTGGCVKATN
jgi:hypothetical protein